MLALSDAPTSMALCRMVWDEETGATAIAEISIVTVELTCESKLWIGEAARPSKWLDNEHARIVDLNLVEMESDGNG